MIKNTKKSLLILVAVVLVCISIGFFLVKENKRAEKEKAAVRLSTLRASLNMLQDGFRDKEKLKKELEKRVDGLFKTEASLEVQIAQIQRVHEEASEQLIIINKAISESQTGMEDLLSEKKQLIKKISRTEPEIVALEERLDILKQRTGALDRHSRKLKREDKLSSANVDKTMPESPTTARVEAASQTYDVSAVDLSIYSEGAFSLDGEVLVSNREFNFIVVSLGEEDGLREGDRLSVYDDDKLLGDVYVETVRKNISAASGGKDLDTYRIKAGNRVRL